VYGVFLPSFDEAYDELSVECIAPTIDTVKPLLGLTRIDRDKTEEGDIVLMLSKGVPSHVGVYVGDGYVLHSTLNCKDTSKLERLNGVYMQSIVEGIYRV
jgi:hypothetical protein